MYCCGFAYGSAGFVDARFGGVVTFGFGAVFAGTFIVWLFTRIVDADVPAFT
jgi:hypothetical protein